MGLISQTPAKRPNSESGTKFALVVNVQKMPQQPVGLLHLAGPGGLRETARAAAKARAAARSRAAAGPDPPHPSSILRSILEAHFRPGEMRGEATAALPARPLLSELSDPRRIVGTENGHVEQVLAGGTLLHFVLHI